MNTKRQDGFILAQLFYGTWVFPLGWLVSKSGFLPKILGILLMADCFAIPRFRCQVD